jgi:two-component system, cell cycle response regulator
VNLKVKVLLVHEGPEHGLALARQFARHDDAARFDLVAAATIPEAQRLLDAGRFDAILLGLHLADASSVDQLVRLHEQAPDATIVVIAETAHPELALAAVRHGAQDCLVRTRLDGAPLSRIVTFAVERQRRVTELRAMSLVDELTGLYNRRGFLALARQQLRVADRLGSRVCQVFVDLDGLKRINDTHGHSEGDRALVETAQLLRETFRESDVIARIGGDEFAVLIMDSQEHAGEAMAMRLRDNVAARNAWAGRQYELSLSTGIACCDPRTPVSVDELLAEADLWMYAHKRQKRRGGTPAGGTPAVNGGSRL